MTYLGRSMVCIFVALMATPLPVSGSSLSARELFVKCEAIGMLNSEPDSEADAEAIRALFQRSQDAIQCAAYLDGFLDGHRLRSEVPLARLQRGMTESEKEQLEQLLHLAMPSFCAPDEGISIERAIEAFMSFVRLRPDLGDGSARIVVLMALEHAYPCHPPE